MFDTIGLTIRISRCPSFEHLVEVGWHEIFTKGYPLRKYVNNHYAYRGLKLTMSYLPKYGWKYSVECSPASWAFGNNWNLADEALVHTTLKEISEFASATGKISFDAFAASVYRIDFANDIAAERNQIRHFLHSLPLIGPPRAQVELINLESALLYPRPRNSKRRNSRKRRNWSVRFYDKGLEYQAKHGKPAEISKLRHEHSYVTSAGVKLLMNKYGLSDRLPKSLLTEELSQRVLLNDSHTYHVSEFFDPAKYRPGFGEPVIQERSRISTFMQDYIDFGPNFYNEQPQLISRSTYFRRLKECQELGLLPNV